MERVAVRQRREHALTVENLFLFCVKSVDNHVDKNR